VKPGSVTIVTYRVLGNLHLRTNIRKMKPNMGGADRVIRLIVAAIVAILYFTGTITGTLGIVLMVLAAVFVLTSFMSFCPLYAPFGFSTREEKKTAN